MTPLIPFNNVFLKREDQNLTGSAKDRAISFQVEYMKKNGYNQAVVSSTGNAALSAQYFCNKFNINLTIFVSPHINKQKKSLLTDYSVNSSPTPISDAFKFAKDNHAYFLRQSTDPIALNGYSQISQELLIQLPDITSIFIPVGSGATLVGISKLLPKKVKLYAVQPASHCPIASYFDSQYTPETSTSTDALSVKLLPLKNQLITAIKNSTGKGVIVQDKDLIDCQNQLINQNIITSAEGALALAGYCKVMKYENVGKFPVILLSGAKR